MYSIFKSLEKYFEFPWSPKSPVLFGFIMTTIIITMNNIILAINNTTIIRLTHRVALQPGLPNNIMIVIIITMSIIK